MGEATETLVHLGQLATIPGNKPGVVTLTRRVSAPRRIPCPAVLETLASIARGSQTIQNKAAIESTKTTTKTQ